MVKTMSQALQTCSALRWFPWRRRSTDRWTACDVTWPDPCPASLAGGEAPCRRSEAERSGAGLGSRLPRMSTTRRRLRPLSVLHTPVGGWMAALTDTHLWLSRDCLILL